MYTTFLFIYKHFFHLIAKHNAIKYWAPSEKISKLHWATGEDCREQGSSKISKKYELSEENKKTHWPKGSVDKDRPQLKNRHCHALY